MKVLNLYKPGDIRVDNMPIPTIKPNEVLVKVMACGVCGSDIPRINYFGAHVSPIVPGHEFSGEVDKVGSEVSDFVKGDKVVVPPLMPCYECDPCKKGQYSLCENYNYFGSRTNGAMAQYVAVPYQNLLKFENISFDDAATIDPAANAIHSLWRGNIKENDVVCVYGVGPIGLFAVQFAKILGAKKVIAVDIFEEKLKIAQELGADEIINSKSENPINIIMSSTNKKGADLVLDTTGAPIAQNQSVLSCAKEGSVVLLGISHKPLELEENAVEAILRRQLNIHGSWNSFSKPFPGREWTYSVELMEKGLLKTDGIISHKLSLEEGPSIFESFKNRDFYFNKVIFLPWRG